MERIGYKKMSKFEMPKMDIAKFSIEDVITTSVDPNLEAAKLAAQGELTEKAQVSTDNIFYFEYAE